MNNTKGALGFLAGTAFGVAGLFVGLWCSWKGFSAQPYTAAELGAYLGFMGMFIGLTLSGARVMRRFCEKKLALR